MKRLIFSIALLSACTIVKAQVNKDTVGMKLPIQNGQIIYTEVVDAPGKTKDELYRNAQEWFIDYFNSKNNFFYNVNDKDGLVYGRGAVEFYSRLRLDANVLWGDDVSIKIECKDNKYRYTFYKMTINDLTDNASYDSQQILGALLGRQKWPWSNNAAKNVLLNNDAKVKSAIADLKNEMKGKSSDF